VARAGYWLSPRRAVQPGIESPASCRGDLARSAPGLHPPGRQSRSASTLHEMSRLRAVRPACGTFSAITPAIDGAIFLVVLEIVINCASWG
jgi:hypothetical protein